MKDPITLGRLSVAIVLSTIIDAIVLAATNNGIMCIVLIPVLMFFFVYMLCRRKVMTFIKVVLGLLFVLMLALAIKFGKIDNKELQQDVDTNTSVSQENKEENNNDENTQNDETQDQTKGCLCGCPYCCRRKS